MTEAPQTQDGHRSGGEVFLSYRRRKLPEIAALARRLESLKVRCWHDLRTYAAADWRALVNAKIQSTAAGIVAFTPDCFEEDSGWVEFEAKALKARNAYIPCCIEPTVLQPPFSRDQAKQLHAWFRPYAGKATLPVETLGVTSGPANSIEWEGVLEALEALVSRDQLHRLDLLQQRVANVLFEGDLEYAIEMNFDLDYRLTAALDFDDLVRLAGDASTWLSASPQTDPCISRITRIRSQLETLLKSPANVDGLFWSDGVVKGRSLSGWSTPGTLFRDAQFLPTMVVIPSGHYTIGSPITEVGRSDSEGPQVPVVIERPFALAATPTTVGQWRRFVMSTGYRADAGIVCWDAAVSAWADDALGTWETPGFIQVDDNPIVGVSWKGAVNFCRWLTEMTGRTYRLPTEAEWEYAARAGGAGPYPWGVDSPIDRAHFADARPGGGSEGAVKVGGFSANSFGLFDMSGNVWEWCDDDWTRGYADMPRSGGARIRPSEKRKVARGGGWRSPRADLRCAARRAFAANEGNSHVGFRVAASLS